MIVEKVVVIKVAMVVEAVLGVELKVVVEDVNDFLSDESVLAEFFADLKILLVNVLAWVRGTRVGMGVSL